MTTLIDVRSLAPTCLVHLNGKVSKLLMKRTQKTMPSKYIGQRKKYTRVVGQGHLLFLKNELSDFLLH